MLLHSALKQTPDATALLDRAPGKGQSSVTFLPPVASPNCTETHDSYLLALIRAPGPQKVLPAHSWALLYQCNSVELTSRSQNASSDNSQEKTRAWAKVSKYQRTDSAPRARVWPGTWDTFSLKKENLGSQALPNLSPHRAE